MTRGPFYDILDTKDETEYANGTVASFEQPLQADRYQYALATGFGGPPIFTGTKIVGTTDIDLGPPVVTTHNTTKLKVWVPWRVHYIHLIIAGTGEGFVYVAESDYDTSYGSRIKFNSPDDVIFANIKLSKTAIDNPKTTSDNQALIVKTGGLSDGRYASIEIQVPAGVTLWGFGFIPVHEEQ